MTSRTIVAALLGLGGLAAALGLLSRDSGPLSPPESRVVLEDATATTLDTVAFQGRQIQASVAGVVVQIDGSGAWVSTGDDAFPLRLDAPDLEVEDHVLAVGRLRGRGGRRWLEVRSWSVLEADVSPPGAGR